MSLPRSKLDKASMGLGSGPWRGYDFGSWKLDFPLMRLVLSTPRPLCAWSVMLSTHQVPLVQQCWTADFASWNDRFYRLCLTSLETVYEVPYAITRFLAAPQLMLDLVPPVLLPPLSFIPGRHTQWLLFRTFVPAALGPC